MSEVHTPTPASPEFALGETVVYADRQGRIQRGRVLHIEAKWAWSETPYLIYSLWHPSYHNNRFYAGVDSILGRAAIAKAEPSEKSHG